MKRFCTLFLLAVMGIMLGACHGVDQKAISTTDTIAATVTTTLMTEETKPSKTILPTTKTNAATSPTETTTTAAATSAQPEETETSTQKTERSTEPKKDTAAGKTCWVSGSTVNLRKAPGKDAAVISKLKWGTKIIRYDADGDWLYVVHGKTKGYVHKDYVSEVQPTRPREDITQTTTTTTPAATTKPQSTQKTEKPTEPPKNTEAGKVCWVSGSTVNFRKTPDQSGEVIRKLTQGTEIIKYGKDGDWLYIGYGETRGYIHKDYVSDSKPAKPQGGRASIVVKKGQRVLELWKGDSMMDSWSIGLGWAPEGHKQVEGDGKTPEGDYYVCVKNYSSSFYLSLGVSYPNKKDASAALEDGRINQATYDRIAHAIDNKQRPDWDTALGGAIMIHGCGGSSDWTAGCIAVDDEVMDVLFEHCSVGTKITILP